MSGNIFNIQRFSTNDGPGIRTVVFLKGCPLSCIWCHNPESKSSSYDIFYDSKKCINCRECEKICKNNQHIFKEDKHVFLRDNCEKCLLCAKKCPANAMEICGKNATSDEVIKEVMSDIEFYNQSGGGLTLSGGEPLMQYDFSLSILKKANISKVNLAGYLGVSRQMVYNYLDGALEYITL